MNGENQNVLGQNDINRNEELPVNTFGVPLENVPTEPINGQATMMVETPAPLNIGVVNPLNGALEVPEEEEEEELPREKTAAELDLERRNKSGLRFIIMFGLMVLIFIILLPFLVTLF